MTTTALSPFAQTIFARTYAFTPQESWPQCAARVANALGNDAGQVLSFETMIRERVFIPGGRYLWSSGRPKFSNANCFGFMVRDSRESWGQLLHDAVICLSMGGGVGVNYSEVREAGAPIKGVGGVASGPISLMQMVNETARYVMMGGIRRSALWAGLHWKHPDIKAFVSAKDWNQDYRAMKRRNTNYSAPLDLTNISVIIDQEYLDKLAAHDPDVLALHTDICTHMAMTGEPAFRNQSLILRDDPTGETGNPCQESTLSDRSTCNLGSIVLPRIRDLNHLEAITRQAVRFLYNGSERATYPTEQISGNAQRERRIGLGFMGLHEWMLQRGGRYDWSAELGRWLQVWQEVSDDEALKYGRQRGNKPVVVRAIAPTGTISIVGETTSGIEPIFCAAYKRRYLNGTQSMAQYVVDPTAQRMLDQGVASKDIEDAYTLAMDVPRRLRVQVGVQQYVDQAISSTINLPAFGTPGNDSVTVFAQTIARALPALKGITSYPDGSREGQPLVPVSIDEAMQQAGVVFEESEAKCSQGVCGI